MFYFARVWAPNLSPFRLFARHYVYIALAPFVQTYILGTSASRQTSPNFRPAKIRPRFLVDLWPIAQDVLHITGRHYDRSTDRILTSPTPTSWKLISSFFARHAVAYRRCDKISEDNSVSEVTYRCSSYILEPRPCRIRIRCELRCLETARSLLEVSQQMTSATWRLKISYLLINRPSTKSDNEYHRAGGFEY